DPVAPRFNLGDQGIESAWLLEINRDALESGYLGKTRLVIFHHVMKSSNVLVADLANDAFAPVRPDKALTGFEPRHRPDQCVVGLRRFWGPLSQWGVRLNDDEDF